jgi:undecaprenyl-diphosphatase
VIQDVLAKEQLALFDRPAVTFLANHRDPAMDNLMRIVTFMGSTSPLLGLSVIVGGWAFLRTKQWRWPLLLSITIGGAIALYDVIKILVERPRPDISPLVHPGGFSFPSGHATAAAAVLTALAYVLTRQTSWKGGVIFWTLALFTATLIGFSRVYLGAHWPTDVFAGLTLGALWTAVTVTSVKLLPSETRKARKARERSNA